MPANMDQIMEIANRWGIPVVEDAASSALSFQDENAVIITTRAEGPLICSTEAQAAKTKFYATQARDQAPHYQHSEIGYNYRLSNVCAGIGRGQMKVLQEQCGPSL